ncbi:MAG: vWA domain-containing protein [Candidatus Thermoplasmatota archaeon]
MAQKKLTLRYQDVAGNKIALNPKDAEELGLDVGDICKIIDETYLELGAAKTVVDQKLKQGFFATDEALADSLTIEEGFDYILEKYMGIFDLPLEKLTVEITDIGTAKDVGRTVTTEHSEVEQFLRGRVVHKGLKLRWKEKGIIMEIKETTPDIKSGEYIIFGDVARIELYAAGTPFNGILLIDMSASMKERDMPVNERVLPMLTSLHNMAENAMPEVRDYIIELEKAKTIRRLDSAAVSAMLYLAEKVARGQGEKTAIITYSDDAKPLTYRIKGEEVPWYDIARGGIKEEREEAAIVIGDALFMRMEQAESKNTNMESALLKAKEIADQMEGIEIKQQDGKTNPIMIILLTDGEYTMGKSPVSVVQRYFANRPKTIIHTIGIGEDADEAVLRRCAEVGKGEYCKAKDLERLLEFYSKHAKRFGTSKTMK